MWKKALFLFSFAATAVWLLCTQSLLANCALWALLPPALWLLGVRRKAFLVPAVAAASTALALALAFLFLRHVTYARYPFRATVEAMAASDPMEFTFPLLYERTSKCEPGMRGPICHDVRGQRLLPALPSKGKNAILFLGGSFTVAENVPDEDSFPFVAAKSVRRPLWNGALSGAGMNSMLFRLEHAPYFLPSDISFSIVIYTFIPQHLVRAAGLGNMRYSRGHPHYELRGGRLALVGTHFDHFGGEFWVRKLGPGMFYFLSGLLVSPYGSFLETPRVPAGVVELAAAEVNRMALLVKQKYGAKFVLNIWPGSRFPDREKFLGLLSPEVEVWEARIEGRMDQTSHPDAEFNRKMGRFLAGKLRP